MRAIARNLTAQGYAQVVTLAVQLGTVPLLIAAWGLEAFGVWLLLTAVPVCLAFCDFGFTFVIKNEMAMQVAAGDRDAALRSYQSVLALLLAILGAVLPLALLLIWLVPVDEVFNLGDLPASVVQAGLMLQAANALIYQLFLLLCAGLRCEGFAAEETFIAATARLAEAAAVVATALAGGGLSEAAGAGLAVRVVALVALWLWLRRRVPWLRLGMEQAQGAVLRRMAGPALGYMAVPLAQALLIQAPVILLAAVAQPAVVALYGVTRTVARLGVAGANVLSHSFTPEYSFARGRADAARFRRLWRLHLRLTLLGLGAYLALAPWVLPLGVTYLSGGTLVPDSMLSGLLTGAVAAELFWAAAFSPMAAVNAHRRVARIFLWLSLSMVAAAAVAPGPAMLAGAVLMVHLLMAGICRHALCHVLPRRGMRRVVFLGLTTYAQTGGLQRFNRRLIDSLHRQTGAEGWQPHAILRNDDPDQVPKALRPIVLVPGRQFKALFRTLREVLRADVLLLGHVNLIPLGWLARMLNPGLRLVLFAHGIEVWGERAYRKPRLFEAWMLRSCDRIAAVSGFTAQRMAQVYGLPTGCFTVFPNTIDGVVTGAEGSRTGFLAVTRLAGHDRAKHLDKVLQALALLPGERLTIVGDGPLRPELEALARELGLDGRVRFAGRVSDAELRRLYLGARVFVLPSSKEGFGIVYLEAWAHGLPVICSTEGAAPEVVRDGVEGFSVAPDDVAALADRMRRLAGSDSLCRQMAAAGQARIAGHYRGVHLDANLRALLKEVV